MTPPAWGIAVVLIVGIIVVFWGWWWDRQRARAERTASGTAATEPPPEPTYLTEDDLPTNPLDDPEAVDYLALREDSATLPGGTPDTRFFTHPRRGVAILVDPTVLVTSAEVETQRMLLTVLAHAARRGRRLVWVASGFDPDAVGTLHANDTTRRVRVIPVELSDPTALRKAVALTGGRLVTASDLAADYLPDEVWGTCAAWVSDTEDSWVITRDPDAAP